MPGKQSQESRSDQSGKLSPEVLQVRVEVESGCIGFSLIVLEQPGEGLQLPGLPGQYLNCR